MAGDNSHSVEQEMDGEVTGGKESIELEQTVNEAFRRVITEMKRKSSKYPAEKFYKVNGKYLTPDLKKFRDEVTIIDRATDGKSGQGADMVQEEFLKKGLSKVATGKINSFPVFR